MDRGSRGMCELRLLLPLVLVQEGQQHALPSELDSVEDIIETPEYDSQWNIKVIPKTYRQDPIS